MTISYMHLTVWLDSLSEKEVREQINIIVNDFSSGEDSFTTHFAKILPLAKYEEALEDVFKFGSQGKILLKPHDP
jgi:hypothetical protein